MGIVDFLKERQAARRSTALLRSYMDKKQSDIFERTNHIPVIGSRGGMYIVWPAAVIQIIRLQYGHSDLDVWAIRYCIGVADPWSITLLDRMLSMMLILELREYRFHQHANPMGTIYRRQLIERYKDNLPIILDYLMRSRT